MQSKDCATSETVPFETYVILKRDETLARGKP